MVCITCTYKSSILRTVNLVMIIDKEFSLGAIVGTGKYCISFLCCIIMIAYLYLLLQCLV